MRQAGCSRSLQLRTATTMFWMVIAIACGNTLASAQSNAWRLYESPTHDFSVQLPGTPEVAESTKKGIESRSATSMLGGCSYRVDAYVYSTNYFLNWNGFPTTFLDDSQRTQLGGMNLRALSQRAVSLQGYPGREFAGDNEKFVLKQRIYLWGGPPERFVEYHLKTFCLKGYEDQQQSDQFLDSFQILASAPHATTWKEFSSSLDHFSVMYPGDPQTTTPVGANGLPMRLYTVRYGTSEYTVGVVTYPYNSIDYTGFPNTMLDTTQRGSLAAAVLTLRDGSQRSITVQGRPGREYLGQGPAISVKARIILRGKPPQAITVYQAIVASPKEFDLEPLATKFLESFQIID